MKIISMKPLFNNEIHLWEYLNQIIILKYIYGSILIISSQYFTQIYGLIYMIIPCYILKREILLYLCF